MAITGPRVQLPSGPFVGEGGDLTVDAQTFLSALQAISFYASRSGTTGSRPTSTSFRWVGMPFMDLSLGYPVFLKFASSNVWVDGAGVVR